MAEVETMRDLEKRLIKLIGLANDAVKAGDTGAILDSAGEIAALKVQITSIQKAEKAAKLAVNETAISKLLLGITAKFDKVYETLVDDIAKLNELGNDVEIVKYIVDCAEEKSTNNRSRICQAGTKSKARTSTGTGGSKSKRTVTLADGTTMDTRAFVDMYASDEEKSTKTFESWPTALTEKIAKRVGATVA